MAPGVQISASLSRISAPPTRISALPRRDTGSPRRITGSPRRDTGSSRRITTFPRDISGLPDGSSGRAGRDTTHADRRRPGGSPRPDTEGMDLARCPRQTRNGRRKGTVENAFWDPPRREPPGRQRSVNCLDSVQPELRSQGEHARPGRSETRPRVSLGGVRLAGAVPADRRVNGERRPLSLGGRGWG